jgi:hypothetical protein
MLASSYAQDDMEERASKLISALKFPANKDFISARLSVFSGKDTVMLGQLKMKRKHARTIDSTSVTDVEILDQDGQIIAVAEIIESSSPGNVQKALAKELVMNTMPFELLIRVYELRKNEIGEFCVLRRTPDKTTGELAVDFSAIHFVRSCTAVSLWGKDIHKIAKALDAMLINTSVR